MRMSCRGGRRQGCLSSIPFCGSAGGVSCGAAEDSPCSVAAGAGGRVRVLSVHTCVPVPGSHSQPQHGLSLQPGQWHWEKQPWTEPVQPGLSS